MQQVNLYSEILAQQHKQSGIKLYSLILATATLACLSFSAYLFWHTNAIETELQQAQLTINQEQARVNSLLSTRSSQQPNELLVAEIELWQNSVNEAAQTLQLLAGKEAQLSQGFSSYFQALANQSSPDVWLTAIHIDKQHQDLRFAGSSFKPEQIPMTFLRLQQEPAFRGQTFAKLAMQKSSNTPGQMDFTLSSSEQPTVKDHAQ